MKKNEFITLLSEELEISSLTLSENTLWANVKEYDSMAVMTIMAICEEHFNKKFTAIEIAKMKTVQNLIEALGL